MELPPSSPNAPRPADGRATGADVFGRGGLLVLLMVACIALGLALSWAMYERRQWRQAMGRIDIVATSSGISEARAGELRDFLALPGTRLIHLRSVNDPEVRTATLLWNPPRSEGIILITDPEAAPYRLVARIGERTIELAHLRPDRRTSIPFASSEPLPADARFELHPADGPASVRFVEVK